MNFEQKLKNYAVLMVKHGLNVQPGQKINISTEVYHRDLAFLVCEEAYRAGAGFVNLELTEPRLARTRYLSSDLKALEYVPSFINTKYDQLVDETWGTLKICGSEYPDDIADIDPKKVNTARMALHRAAERFYEEGLGKSKVHWSLAAAATPRWAAKVFKDLPPDQAVARLWDEIFKICRVDKENFLELWRDHNAALHGRAHKLNGLKIEALHFTGPGTDLHVGLSERARFKGGGDISPLGVEFEPNLPTEECFTTPDWRKTSGTVRATRPFLVSGTMVRGLSMRFAEGRIIDFKAESGAEAFAQYIDSDPGGRRLGEVALVGTDSPVFQSGLIFEDILYDENAACHIAVGLAYKFCVDGGASLSAEELERIGCNSSSVHTDIMISSEEVNVTAKTFSGETIKLIENGHWAIFD